MSAAGAPLVEGLTLAAPTVRNRALRAAVLDLAGNVREGGSLSAAMKRAGVFPPVLVHMTASGEQAGQLEPLLEGAANYLERDVAAFTSAVVSLLEPVIIVVMGLIVGTIVLSILLPILAIDTLTLR
jgi:general secretion pathway protein F